MTPSIDAGLALLKSLSAPCDPSPHKGLECRACLAVFEVETQAEARESLRLVVAEYERLKSAERAAFEAGFLAVSPFDGATWSFTPEMAPIAADLEPEAWDAWNDQRAAIRAAKEQP